MSCSKLYVSLGVKRENIVMLDSKGVIRLDRKDLTKEKKAFATKRKIDTIEEALDGADMFLGLSRGGHKIGIRYILKGNDYFKLFFHNKSSSLLSQAGFSTLTVLPSYADVSSQLYGIETYNANLDYLLNPRKGYQVKISGSLGNKTIKKNPQIDEKLYEDLDLKSTLYNAELNANYYFPITKRSIIKLATKNSYTFNENLFENELLRVGGLLTLRGFDEESIFASFYTIETLEYRYILEQNSYLYLFFDGAYYENDRIEKFVSDRPYGFGAGMSFETKAGIFSISYALGKQFNNPIKFSSAKIHFGFVNFF